MKVVRSALRTGRLYPARKYSWYLFLLEAVSPQGHSVAGRIMSMKNSSDIWNRTRDLPACTAVPQPTVPSCIPHSYRSSSYSLSSATQWRPYRAVALFTRHLLSSPMSWQAEARSIRHKARSCNISACFNNQNICVTHQKDSTANLNRTLIFTLHTERNLN